MLPKFTYNNYFTKKFLFQYGIQLGGHLSLLEIENTSVVFGIRTQNAVINLNLTAMETMKSISIVRGLGFKRGVLYFVNSMISLRLSFKSSFQHLNRHLFLPISAKMKNLLKQSPLTSIEPSKLKKLKKVLTKKKFFLFQSGKTLLKKVFVSTKWFFGFVSNGYSFFSFVQRVLQEKIKVGRKIDSYKKRISGLADSYPFLPNFGFIGDFKSNYWIMNEFKRSNVPNASVVDVFTNKALQSVYGIPGNASSIDSTLFFLILNISSYLVGFNLQICQFILSKEKPSEFRFQKKVFLFKKLRCFSWI